MGGLLQPSSFPHPVDQLKLIETHISRVYLAGDYAYKTKKPVNLGFLDFTTLRKRQHFCLEELRLNRRLSPGLYLDVVAIVGSGAQLGIAPLGTRNAVDYAVKMRRFEQSSLLDHMLAAGRLLPQHLDALAFAVAHFHLCHATKTCVLPEKGYGNFAMVENQMLQNFSQICPLLDSQSEIARADDLKLWSTHTLESLHTVLEERRNAGFVRECHGDLHLGNIISSDTGIEIFDCIEFDPALRWIDVASEIAFTVMDLCARGHPDWGARFLNTYLEITWDYAAIRLLPFFLVYRALVRAKVARIRASQASGEEREVALRDFADHVELATSFTVPRRLALIIMHGLSGSGKTTVSQGILEKFSAVRLRSDVVRKRLHDLEPDERSGSALAADLYADSVSQATYAELLRMTRMVLSSGFPVVVDAAFLQRNQREPFRQLAIELGIPFLIVDCIAQREELQTRLRLREVDGRDASEANGAVLDWQLVHEQTMDQLENAPSVTVDTQNFNPDELFTRIASRTALPYEPAC